MYMYFIETVSLFQNIYAQAQTDLSYFEVLLTLTS